MNLRSHRFFAVAIVITAAAFPARGGLVQPGESTVVNSADFVSPAGLLIAEGSVDFTLHYTGGASIDGTLIDSVLRDPFSNQLTFIYNVILNPTGATDGTGQATRLAVDGFAGASTDLSGFILSQPTAVLARSADGAIVEIHNAAAGQGGSPLLVIKTDATQFDARGGANFSAADQFPTDNLGVGATPTATGEAAIEGAFRPITDSHEVPLPPAAYSALGVVVAYGMLLIGRRRTRTAE